MINLEDCEHGFLYKLNSRNLSYGVFNKDHNGFVGIREKFYSRFLDYEYHWDTGAPFGTAKPIEKIKECPVKDLRAIGDLICTICRKPAKSVKNEETGYYDKFHEDGTVTCEKYSTAYDANVELFKWLDEQE